MFAPLASIVESYWLRPICRKKGHNVVGTFQALPIFPGRWPCEDGTFKPAEELRSLYESKGITSEQEVIAYCRIGERSSHTWFVLHYLLGYPKVRNYDGSWTEWGSLIGVPIEK
jgi:3-mercaptopyruvate sulfurtransferase SseA